MITFTPPEVFAGVVAIIGLLLTILNIIDKMSTINARAKEPEKEQNDRLKALEDEVKEIKDKLNNDNERIQAHEKSEKVMMQALKALLSHSIDGNNVDEMKDAAKGLDAYLINK